MVLSQHITSQTLPEHRAVDWTLSGLDTSKVQRNLVDLSEYNLDNQGLLPNDLILKDILDSAGSTYLEITFPPGKFLFNQPIELKSGTLLNGAGADSTTLIMDLSFPDHSFKAVGDKSESDTSSFINTANKDSSRIQILNSALFQAGDWVHIQMNDSGLVTSNWAKGTVGQIARIKLTGNQSIELYSPLRMTFDISRKPRIQKINPVSNIGIECLKIIRQDTTSPVQSSNVFFDKAVNCWVNGIESENCNYSHIEARQSSNLKIASSYFHHGLEYGSGGRAYGVMLHFTTNECLIENNIFEHLRHSMIVQAGANGNVFTYNYSHSPFWDLTPSDAAGDIVLHGNYPFSNLFEHNINQNTVIDNSHGANGPFNTFFRNKSEHFGIFFSDTTSPNQNIIGNVVSNLNIPYSLVNYRILGAGHFLYGNNNKGNIHPTGTNSLPDSTYAYYQKPDFIPPTQWLSIGNSSSINSGSIPALSRFTSGEIFKNTCGYSNDLNVKLTSKESPLLSVYPNPSEGIVNVKSTIPLQNMEVFNQNGIKVQSVSFSGNYKCSLESLKPGFYFLKFNFEDRTTLYRNWVKM